jgi:hypothetical protein
MTQQEFANKITEGAIVTVGRWETSRPPHGKTLLDLAKIARDHNLVRIEAGFIELYYREVYADTGEQQDLLIIVRDDKPTAYIFAKLTEPDQIRAAKNLVKLLPGKHSIRTINIEEKKI